MPRRPVAPLPAGLAGEIVRFDSSSGARLAAWLFVPDSPRAAVVLLHGYRDDRSSMLPEVELLVGAGYAVLAPDLQAHGESTGERITFGQLESRDALAAVDYPSGTEDRRTTEAETRRLFEAARPPKELWLVEGAAHVGLLRHDPAGYRRRVLDFLDRHLLAPLAPDVGKRAESG